MGFVMKHRLVLALVALIGCSPIGAFAQKPPPSYGETRGLVDYSGTRDRAGAKRKVQGNPLEIVEAGKLIKAAGSACEAIDARSISHGKTGDTYEVACADGLGWVVTGLDGKTTAYDCLALAAAARMSLDPRAHPATCRLAMNDRPEAGLEALLKTKGITTCTAVNAAYQGSGGMPPISRYEVACKEGGYLIDAPTPGSKATLEVTECGKAAEIGGACTLKR